VVFLTLSALADTTFVVFPHGSFIAASFADDNLQKLPGCQKDTFCYLKDIFCANMYYTSRIII